LFISSPIIQTGYSDGDIVTTNPNLNQDPKSPNGTYITHVNVTSGKVGVHKVCLQTGSSQK